MVGSMVRELTFAEGERMRKRVIALDIGNVCLEIHPERCFAALGYRLVRVEAVDLFPGALHIEAVGLFVKEAGESDT